MPDRASGFQFYPEWRIALATALLLPFLVGLGFWQLERAREKADLGEIWEQRSHEPPTPLSQVVGQDPDTLAFKPILVTGKYVEDAVFLLDNRIHKGQFGYEVLALFDVDGINLSVLVNRGWIGGDPARLSLPQIPREEAQISLSGHLYIPQDKPFLLAEQIFEPDWPKRIQALEMDKIAQAVPNQTSQNMFPHLLRIDNGQPSALTVDWKIVNVSPEKHVAYAFQWFAMAVFLAILYLLRSTNLWQLLPFTKRD